MVDREEAGPVGARASAARWSFIGDARARRRKTNMSSVVWRTGEGTPWTDQRSDATHVRSVWRVQGADTWRGANLKVSRGAGRPGEEARDLERRATQTPRAGGVGAGTTLWLATFST
jgi:hypothetical protein